MENFVPFRGRTGPFVNVLPSTVGPVGKLSGNGSPEGAVSSNVGTRYRDLLTNDLWVKFAGTQAMGWVLVGKDQDPSLTVVGASAQAVFSGTATDPNGVITATNPAKYYSLTDGSQWDKTDTGATNTGWQKVS
jgi:hypothetical protein